MRKIVSLMLVIVLLFATFQSCAKANNNDETWACKQCGEQSSGNFCSNCGATRDDFDDGHKNETNSTDDKNEETLEPIVSTDDLENPTSEDVTDKTQDYTKEEDPNTSTEFSFDISIGNFNSIDELEDSIEEYVDDAIDSLLSQWDSLSAKIDSYSKYVSQSNEVSNFYQTVLTSTESMCIVLKEYTALYARMILDSDLTNDKKYKAIDGIHDAIYEDAIDEIKDEIYDGILDDAKDCFYDGVLDKQPDGVSYSDWYDITSKEYSQWYDTSSEVYSVYYNASSDIYSFYYDMATKIYSGDIERAEKIYNNFLKKIAKEKGLETSTSNISASFDTSIKEVSTTDELENIVESQVLECTQSLINEWNALSSEINTYDKYKNNTDKIEDFHIRIENCVSDIFVMICDYGINYAKLILQSNDSLKEQYKNFEDFKNCIYDDACEAVKDEIYDSLLNDIKDYYYDGIIKQAKDNVKYSDWSDARSDTYSWWSDTRSEVYSLWSNTRGDVYSFWSDIRSELYSGDSEGATKELERFQKKVDRMR